MEQSQLEQSNRAKYGDQKSDVIAQAYAMGRHVGDIWCVFNVWRYLSRYIRPGSTKAGNLTDMLKARDYLDRAIQQHPDNGAPLKEIIEKPDGAVKG